MFCELGGDGRGVDAGRLEVVILVAQHADDFRRQCLVENLDHGFSVGLVAFGDRTLLCVLARAAPRVLDTGHDWLGPHGVIGRASRRGSVCPTVEILVVAVTLNTRKPKYYETH